VGLLVGQTSKNHCQPLKVAYTKYRGHNAIPTMEMFLEHPHQSSGCDPSKPFFISKFTYLLFCNTTHKTKMGLAKRWRTTSNKPSR